MNKDKIIKILRESTETITPVRGRIINPSEITKISIMDFDGTLVDTPLPDDVTSNSDMTGREEWEAKTGTPYPSKGWWGRPESLDIDVFAHPVIPDVISAYKIEMADPNTLVVMMTGRLQKLSPMVEAILAKYNLTFDEYIYNRGGQTIDSKLNDLNRLISENPNVKEVHLWDDRLAHITHFEKWGAGLKNIKFGITVVNSSHH